VQKIIPFLWFDGKAEEAAQFYTAIFPNSTIGEILRNGPQSPGPEGTALTVTFELEGQRLIALNGGPHYQFSPAISFVVNCETQAEVDHYWDQLSAGGKPIQCGWLNDKFGVTWQIVPTILPKLLTDKEHPDKAKRAMQVMMTMVKLDIKALQDAYDGK
jgi:predicted 3-demethylubiquinone-9 3-methyltransferase (glyoxalase superfamily)